MKAMKWSNDHVDVYVFHKRDRVWIKAKCKLETHMECVAPSTLPAGTQFSYNVGRQTDSLRYAANLSLEHYDALENVSNTKY